jgi:hypothetical protein
VDLLVSSLRISVLYLKDIGIKSSVYLVENNLKRSKTLRPKCCLSYDLSIPPPQKKTPKKPNKSLLNVLQYSLWVHSGLLWIFGKG